MRNRIENSVHDFVATHENIITNKAHERDENIDVRFTRWGNSVARRCLIDVIDVCDEETKLKILDMMDNKRAV
jgi:hypothetical protein